jgi:hypothetical protein
MKTWQFLILCTLVLISAEAFGQSYLGVHAGIDFGKLSGDSPSQFKYASSSNLAFGLSYDFQLKEDIFLGLGVSYLNSDSKLKYPKEVDEQTVYEDSINLDFQLLTIPVLLKLISDNKKFEFSGGFEMIFPTKFTADNSADKVDVMDEFNRVNFSMIFGIGYRIPIKKSLLVINLSYSQGLTNLANNLEDPDSLFPRIRLTSFRLAAGWRLPVGKNKFQHSSTN